MLRSGGQIKNRLRLSSRSKNGRGLSTTSQGTGGRTLAIAGTTVLVSGAATVGAAWQFPSFRKTVETNIPPVKFLFNPILGPLHNEVLSGSTPKKSTYKPAPKKDIFESPLGEVRREKEKSESKEVELQTELSNSKIEQKEKSIIDIDKETVSIPILLSPDIEKPENSTVLETEVVENREISDNFSGQNEPVETQESANFAPEVVSDQVNDDVDESVKTRTPEEVESTLIELEEDAIADAAAISTILGDALSTCAQQCVEAIESNTEAAKAISLHTSLLRSAMDDTQKSAGEKHDQWTDLSRVLEQKSRLRQEAENNTQDARKEISKLEAVISEVKRLKNPEVNQKIIDAEENCNAMRRELENTQRDINVKLSESHVISEYKDLIDTAKEQFRQELLSVMPDVKIESGWRKLSQKLSEDDLNALIAHAHRRVDQLQRELAEERAISTTRMETAVRAARERWEEASAVEMEKQVEVLKRESEIEHDKKMEEARQAFESEMRVQLKRQAAAHSDHLTDMLGIQEKQIKTEFEEKLQSKLLEQEQNFTNEMESLKTKYEDELHTITDKFQFDLNKALAKVAGIETVIDGRAYVENESRKAQELWLACEALRIAVQYGDNGKPTPLQRELQAISHVEGIESHIIEMVESFPVRANERGVFTEESLRAAYKQVSKMCKRLSLINETRNSMFSYFLSYLKSFLIVSRAQTEPPTDLQVSDLDTFKILSYATYSLESGDLEQATRFMNQLTGEPRRVAEGWLQEVRLLLETRQTVKLLSSLASATSIAANLEM